MGYPMVWVVSIDEHCMYRVGSICLIYKGNQSTSLGFCKITDGTFPQVKVLTPECLEHFNSMTV